MLKLQHKLLVLIQGAYKFWPGSGRCCSIASVSSFQPKISEEMKLSDEELVTLFELLDGLIENNLPAEKKKILEA